MRSQAYFNTIQIKTGKSPSDFRRMAERKGFTNAGKIKAGVKAGEIVYWLNRDFNLDHAPSLAIYELLKN